MCASMSSLSQILLPRLSISTHWRNTLQIVEVASARFFQFSYLVFAKHLTSRAGTLMRPPLGLATQEAHYLRRSFCQQTKKSIHLVHHRHLHWQITSLQHFRKPRKLKLMSSIVLLALKLIPSSVLLKLKLMLNSVLLAYIFLPRKLFT